MMVPVILSGGSGTRLWPVSRRYYPKQFHALTGDLSLFQETVRRCRDVAGSEHIVVLTNDDYRFILSDQLDSVQVHDRTIILEPALRNTAPAIALAAFQLSEINPQIVMLVAPSDHLIKDQTAFSQAIEIAGKAAARGRLVTLGIVPTYPATAYGYIQSGPAADELPEDCYSVENFVEKPDAGTAAAFLEDASYYWNSGMFLFTAETYLGELERHQPDIVKVCREAWRDVSESYGFVNVGKLYENAPAVSIDYAVMEKTDKSVVVPYSGDWSDIGSWTSLAETCSVDSEGNATTGNVQLTGTGNSFIFAKDRLVAGLGLRDTIVVETKDAVLVAARDKDQDVKQVVELLKSDGAVEVDYHTEVFRPWGSYEDLDKGDGFHVKRLTIKPGASISLQRHFYRSEHWVVVQGEARVIRGKDEFVLRKNESTYIPCETVHKLSNEGAEDLVIVEVQTGDRLDESDIERLKDDYGRS